MSAVLSLLKFQFPWRPRFQPLPHHQWPPRDYHFLSYEFDNLLFFYTAFAFGLRSATLGCQRTTNAITYLYLLEGFSAQTTLMILVGVTHPHEPPTPFMH